MYRVICWLVLLAVLAFPAVGVSAERPNIVLFLVDDMGWMDSEPYGSQYYETPHMQRLAAQAMRFTDAYAVPLCSPTRASILTGQYSSRHGITSATGHLPAAAADASRYPAAAAPNRPLVYAHSKNYLDPGLASLAKVLQQAGYRTGHFGKWHLGLEQPHWPEQHGFDVTFHAQPSPGPPSYHSPYGVHKDGKPAGRHHVGNITDGPDGEYITDRLTDEAIAFLEANQDRPFFLNFWHYGVHGPWGHKEEYTAQFAEKTDPRGEQRNPIMASMLRSVDESLGRVIAKLDELGLSDNTLFIFYSDNGGNVHSNTPDSRQMQNIGPDHPKYGFVQDWKRWAGPEPPTNNAPLREGKGRIYEGGQRVPLMVRWPGQVEPGTTSDAIVGPIDLYPTILETAGVKKPEGHIVDGESLWPVLKQSGKLKRKAYFTWFPHLIPAASVRQGDWKLIRRFEPHRDYPDLLELYNLREDIGETQNLAQKRPEKVRELAALLDAFQEETGALLPKPNPAFRETPKPSPAQNAGRLVPRNCELTEADGAALVTGTGRQPFLGIPGGRLKGPIALKLVARSTAGGQGRVTWKTAEQETFPDGQQTGYQLPPGDTWQEVNVRLPLEGEAGILRLYLPAVEKPVEIRSIRFTDAAGQTKAWDFAKLAL